MEHWTAVENILRYIKGTINFGLVYLREKEKEMMELLGYSDSDFAGDMDDRKSTSGVIYFLGENSYHKSRRWSHYHPEKLSILRLQPRCVKVWLVRLSGDLTGEEPKGVVLNVDDKSTISLWKNPVHHDRCKH